MLAALAQAAPPLGPVAEDEIQHLLHYVGESHATFIRNGEEYPPAEAVAHLQRKWDYHQKKISTAEDFISLAGTKSLFTGKIYWIRTQAGTTVESRVWLGEELARYRTEKNPSPLP